VLRTSDFSQVLKVGQTASVCDDVDQLRSEILNMLPDVFAVERAFFILARSHQLPRLNLDSIVSRGMDPKYMALFREHYYKTDPIFKVISLSKVAVPFRDVVSYHHWIRTERYRDFVKPQSIGDGLSINIRTGNRLLGVLSLIRSEHEHDFSSDEIVKAELIAPYLAAGIEKATFLDKARKTEQILSAICRDLPYRGIIVLDESLTPIYMNEEARKILSQSFGGPEHSEDPSVTLPKDLHLQCQKLLRNHSGASSPEEKQRVDLIVKNEKRSIPVQVSLVHDSKNSRLCLICIGRSEPKSMLPEQSIKLGLTRRESEIVSFVCQGLTNSEISEKLFISEATVENHLHSMFEKMGVKNRTSLVYRVTHSGTQ
jgi:DNA-binding CsgD family transcriptional regulator